MLLTNGRLIRRKTYKEKDKKGDGCGAASWVLGIPILPWQLIKSGLLNQSRECSNESKDEKLLIIERDGGYSLEERKKRIVQPNRIEIQMHPKAAPRQICRRLHCWAPLRSTRGCEVIANLQDQAILTHLRRGNLPHHP